MALGVVIALRAVVVGVGTIAAVTAKRAAMGCDRRRRRDGHGTSDTGTGRESMAVWAGADDGGRSNHHGDDARHPTTAPSADSDGGNSGGDSGGGGGDGGGGGGGGD